MQLIRFFRSFLVYSNLAVGLGFWAFLDVTYRLEGGTGWPLWIPGMALGTVSFYTIIRLMDAHQGMISTINRVYQNYERFFIGWSIGTAFLAVVLMWDALPSLWRPLTTVTVIGLVYVVPGPVRGLRYVAGLKLFLIALAWAWLATRSVASILQLETGAAFWLSLLRNVCWVAAITVPFDIRDMEEDEDELGSLPQRFGPGVARGIALMALFLVEVFVAAPFLMGRMDVWPFVGLFLGIELTGVVVYFSYPVRSFWYYALWLELTPVLVWLLYTAGLLLNG
jgi:hypothetical protein